MSNELQLHPGFMPVATVNIDGFIQAAHQFPVLSKEDEFELAREYKRFPDENCGAFIAEVRKTHGFENTPIIVLTGDEVDASSFDPDLKISRICQKALGIGRLTDCILETLAQSPESSQILRDFMPII